MRKAITIFMCLIITVNIQTIKMNGETIVYDGKEYAYSNSSIKILVDGVEIENEAMYPVVLNDRTLVPVREIMESAGIQAKVEWLQESKTVHITKDNKVITLKVGESKGYVNGIEILLDTEAKLIKDKSLDVYKMMVPIRFVSESLGYQVEWNKEDKEVILTSLESSFENFSQSESDITYLNQSEKIIELPTKLKTTPFNFKINDMEPFIVLEDGINKDGINKADFEPSQIMELTANETESKFIIKSINKVSTVKYTVEDEKLILDIEGLIMNDFPTTIRMDKGVHVSAVRTSQYDYSPYIGRITFDLHPNSIPREVIISGDRKTVEVTFNDVGLNQIDILQDYEGDKILLKGDYSDFNAFRLNDPSRLVFDFNHTINQLSNRHFKNIEGQMINNIVIGMPDNNITRFIVETNDHSDFDLNYDKVSDITTIKFKPLVYSKVSFNYEKYPTLIIPKTTSLSDYDIKNITQTTGYLGFKTTFNFNQSIKELEGNQNFFVGDIHTNNLIINSQGSNTQITFDNKHILEYTITEDEAYIYIQGIRPKDLYETMVLLDAGHGGYDPGAVYNNLLEKDVNLKLMKYIHEHTEKRQEVKYYYTRVEDVAISLPDRVKIANDLEVDLFVSMHNNAIDIKKNPSLTAVRGLEVIITVDTETSAKEMGFAKDIFANMSANLPELVLREIKDYNKLYLLKYSDMPAVIIEYGYLTNPSDVENLKKDWILEEAARITELTIFNYFYPK